MIMGGVKFYRSLQFPFNPLFSLKMKNLEDWVERKCPLLKYEKNIVLYIDFPQEICTSNTTFKYKFGSDSNLKFIFYA